MTDLTASRVYLDNPEEVARARFGGGKTTGAAIVTAAGDTTIVTPTAGKRLTLYWVGLSSSQDNASGVLATVRLGALVAYRWFMGAPGAFAHWEPVDAPNVDDPLVVNLSAATSPGVAVNFTVGEA